MFDSQNPFIIRIRVNSSNRLLRQLLNVLSDYMALLDYDRLKKIVLYLKFNNNDLGLVLELESLK